MYGAAPAHQAGKWAIKWITIIIEGDKRYHALLDTQPPFQKFKLYLSLSFPLQNTFVLHSEKALSNPFGGALPEVRVQTPKGI